MVDVSRIKAQALALEEYEKVKAAIARVDDALAQKAHVYHVEATDHALSHRSVEFHFTPEESAPILKGLKPILNARLAALKASMEKH